MQYNRLLCHCIHLLDTFDSESTAVETHINTYLKNEQIRDEEDQTFLLEVFSGCVRYASVLQVITDGFFNRDGKVALRSQRHLYTVIAYIALFRLEELGIDNFSFFVHSQDASKMHTFLKFLLDEQNLKTWMKDAWCRLYDHTFVQNTLLSPLLGWKAELDEMLHGLEGRLETRKQPKKAKLPATSVKPFSLTEPQPRKIPVPEPIPKLAPSKPVPVTTAIHHVPAERETMARVRELNRRKAEERLMEASKMQFACANPEMSEKARRRLEDILTEEDYKLDFDRHKSNPVPATMLSENIPIRLNAATILREGHHYKKQEAQQLKKLEQLESGARDKSEFDDWQSRMLGKDWAEAEAEAARRRISAKLSHEEAILATHNMTQTKKQQVADMKQQAMALLEDFYRKKEQEEEDTKRLVGEIHQTKENAKNEKKKLQKFKADIVQSVKAESRQLMEMALKQAEEELKEKVELIRQIRAMEAAPIIPVKLVDFTHTPGHGLLSEMSTAELRERLCLLRIRAQEEEDEIRDNILAAKQEKDRKLLETLDTIGRHRREQTKAAAVKLETRKKNHDAQSQIQDESVLELEKQLAERRAQRRTAQLGSRTSPHQFTSAKHRTKGDRESRWRELEITRENTAQIAARGVAGSATASRIASRTALRT